MKILLEHSQLTSYTLQHLLEWVESVSILANTPEWPFPCTENLAIQLEMWREEFQTINSGCIAAEEVKITAYGEDTILLADEQRGEYVKLTIN